MMGRLVVKDVDVPGFEVCWPVLEDHVASSEILVEDFATDRMNSVVLLGHGRLARVRNQTYSWAMS